MGDWSWFFWTLGVLVLLLGLLLVLRGRWRDTGRHTLRCPKCWYPMGEVVQVEYSRLCPECGTTSVGEDALRRVRRRWSVRFLGLAVAMLGGALLLTPRAVSLGIFSVFPTTALLLLEPYFHEDRYMLPEDVTSFGMAAPPTSAIAKELQRRQAATTMKPWQWTLYLARADLVRTRAHWPRNIPVAFEYRSPSWIAQQPVPGQARYSSIYFRVDPAMSPDASPKRRDPSTQSLQEMLQGGYLEAPNDSGRTRFQCSAKVYSWGEGDTKPRDLFPTVTCSTSVSLVDHPEDAIRADPDAAIADTLRQECRTLLFFRPETHMGRPAPRFSLRTDAYSLPTHLAYGLSVEIRRDGQTVATGFMNNPRERVYFENAVHIEIGQWMFEDAKADLTLARWDAVIRGDARSSLRDIEKDAYWSGEFVVPVRFQP